MGHHLWQSRRPGGPLLQRKDRARRGCVRREAGGPAPGVTRLQMKTEAERFLKGKSRTGSPPFSPFLIAQSLSLSVLSPSIFPSLPPSPPRPLCLPFSSLRLFEHPAFRSPARKPQRSAPRGPLPCVPAQPPPLPGPFRSGSHPEEQVEAEQQVLDAPQGPAEAPHAAAPAAGSRVPRPGLGAPAAPGAGGEGAEREGPWAGPAGGGGGAGLEPAQGERGPGRTPSQEAGDGWERRWVGGRAARRSRYPAHLRNERPPPSLPRPGDAPRRHPSRGGYRSICEEGASTGDPRLI